MIFGAVQRDQRVPTQAAHGVQTAGLFQFGDDVGEHGVKMRWLDRVEHIADMIVAGALVDTEQRLAVRATLGGLQISLMRQEGRALHEEGGEGGEGEIRHRIGRVLPAPRIGQGLAITAQRGEESIQDGHGKLESRIMAERNRLTIDLRGSFEQCDICDSPNRTRQTTVTSFRSQQGPQKDRTLK
jgi:hypothetical protein